MGAEVNVAVLAYVDNHHLNPECMENSKRDLLVLLKENNQNQQALNDAVDCLNRILSEVECNEVFCQAHELVTRNSITRKPRKILKAVASFELKPFYFLINRN